MLVGPHVGTECRRVRSQTLPHVPVGRHQPGQLEPRGGLGNHVLVGVPVRVGRIGGLLVGNHSGGAEREHPQVEVVAAPDVVELVARAGVPAVEEGAGLVLENVRNRVGRVGVVSRLDVDLEGADIDGLALREFGEVAGRDVVPVGPVAGRFDRRRGSVEGRVPPRSEERRVGKECRL